MFRTVVVGISGGVDSAIAAYLIKRKGYDVLGVFMKNWDEIDEVGRCSGEQDFQDAQYACQKIGIELRQVNFVKSYWNSVFTGFLDDYRCGLTPNPDILCNKYIKFHSFYKYALEELGYDAIATGHYAKTSYGSYLENYKDDKNVSLLIPKDRFKDQTFFLSNVQRKALSRTMFPLSNYLKSEVKSLARQCGLQRLAEKRESTGICFVGNRNFKKFINEYIEPQSGNFVDVDTGKVVGGHQGIHQWTIGQRCRLASFSKPYFVAQKDVKTNTIYVALGHNHPKLYSDKIEASNAVWLCSDPLMINKGKKFRCLFRFQHTKPLVACFVQESKSNSGNLTIVLHKPLRAITPGQFAVFYNETACLGSARIINSKVNQD